MHHITAENSRPAYSPICRSNGGDNYAIRPCYISVQARTTTTTSTRRIPKAEQTAISTRNELNVSSVKPLLEIRQRGKSDITWQRINSMHLDLQKAMTCQSAFDHWIRQEGHPKGCCTTCGCQRVIGQYIVRSVERERNLSSDGVGDTTIKSVNILPRRN